MPYKNPEDHRNWGRAYAREWRRRNPKRASEGVLRSRDPVKHRARAAVAYAKKMGRLSPEPCEMCGATEVQAHHDDYTQPLVVRWFCRRHHVQVDRDLA